MGKLPLEGLVLTLRRTRGLVGLLHAADHGGVLAMRRLENSGVHQSRLPRGDPR